MKGQLNYENLIVRIKNEENSLFTEQCIDKQSLSLKNQKHGEFLIPYNHIKGNQVQPLKKENVII